MATDSLRFILWIVLALFWTPAQSLQYCQVDPVKQTDYCLALKIVHNEETRSDDYYMTASVGFPDSKYGWVAVGAGSYIMHRSLMFVMYPSVDLERLVVGVRSTEYHDEPKLPGDAPNLTVTHSSFEQGYHTASFVCHSCNRWDGAALGSDTLSMPWIWASEPFQPATSDNSNKALHRHEYYGDFFMDMASGKSSDASFPTITRERISINAGTKRLDSNRAISNKALIALHGFLLAFAFSVCYPLGVAALLVNIKWHYVVQIVTSVMVLMGIFVALYCEMSASSLQSLTKPHQALGLAIGMMIGGQVFLGWRNHVQYLESRQPPRFGNAHRWLGRVAYVSGVGNVLLGVTAAGLGRRLAIAWCFLVSAQLIGYLWIVKMRSQKKTMAIEKADHGYYAIASDEEMLESDD